MAPTVSADDVERAALRIAGEVHRTPVVTCRSLDLDVGAQVFMKCENFQRVGAFKFRGASNAIIALDEAVARRGVACHSSGNHAQAVALAARRRGIPATVVMPVNAPAVKRAAVEGYGARIVDCEPTPEARAAGVAEVVAATGAAEIHPFDNDFVIAGQGTAALELVSDVSGLDTVLAPVGGGGLLSGTSLAVSANRPEAAVFGAEPGVAPDAQRSLRTGRLDTATKGETIADGLRTHLSERTLAVIVANVADIVTVDEGAIISAMRFLWERTKLVVEPSGAVAVAALRAGLVPGERIGVIISGGNVDLDHLPWASA